ncbi:Protein phosphatase Slingshot [Eumeta japonica]|uniref:protein-serine/threonine phosphatase n=1 Tax=Eumeta variegata TaxID=151549 RepID=A0A4C1W9S6_EUMVA|nr:Protein phosphatase Slingshot [Eumeta japonica]
MRALCGRTHRSRPSSLDPNRRLSTRLARIWPSSDPCVEACVCVIVASAEVHVPLECSLASAQTLTEELSALQTLHRASACARKQNHFAGGTSHAWAAHYEDRVDSDRSCLNEWHAMDCLESRRPPSPDSLRHKPLQRNETESVIRSTLKEIMMSVDLDEVTSKAIRGRLEEEFDMDLTEYKSFIDEEMIKILGQMDAPTEIFDHVYLGSEWNASNLEELQRNGVGHILNVTREIDNFFPGMFNYLNIRVYDDEKTDLLKHWDNTYKYISKAQSEGSKVLVHCKMGISRSASVVIAYAMKAYNWNFDKALRHVKEKRSCIKPNTNFLNQLETYQGILDAMKNKEKLQRSKSETNLKSPKMASKLENKILEPTPLVQALTGCYPGRPRSWSPDTKLAAELRPPTSVSLENLATETRHMLMPCANGSYSVSPNQIIRLKEEGTISVKHIVNEIENAAAADRKDITRRILRLNFVNALENNKMNGSTVGHDLETSLKSFQISPSKNTSHNNSINTEIDKIHTWDPGERVVHISEQNQNISDSDNIVKCDSGIIDLNLRAKINDNFSNLTEHSIDFDEKRRNDDDVIPPSRQSSWSSFDSAVVPDLSRHSSWGSYDTRSAKTQLMPKEEHNINKKTAHRLEGISIKKDEELSDKKVDCDCHASPQKIASDLSIINEHIESHKKSRVKVHANISENERKFNETCAILKELTSACHRDRQNVRGRGSATWCGRLSASAPTESWLRSGLRRRRPTAASHGDLSCIQLVGHALPAPRAAATAGAGLVRNLKMEFEALSGSTALKNEDLELETQRRTSKSRNQCLPSAFEKKRAAVASQGSIEDLSVKVLVDKYDNHSCKSKCEPACEVNELTKHSNESVPKKCKSASDSESKTRTGQPSFLRNSFCGVIRSAGSAERPPIAPNVVSMPPMNYPNVVVATVMTKAQNKKQMQHGKTHPLTRLNLNRSNNRCSNPVYNTM